MSEVFKRITITRIAKSIPNLTRSKYEYKTRDRALFCLLYLTGARIGEIVKRVKKEDFEFIRIQGNQFLIVELYTEKNRKHPHRRVPINIVKEKTLVNYLIEYLDKIDDNDVLFDFSIQRAWQIIANIIGKYKQRYRNKFMNANHFLRHCRLTHLVVNYDFTDQDLVMFTGWSDSTPATAYMHLRYKDLARKMI